MQKPLLLPYVVLFLLIDCAVGFFRCDQPRPDYFACLPPDYVCDGDSDCADAQDENGCRKYINLQSKTELLAILLTP